MFKKQVFRLFIFSCLFVANLIFMGIVLFMLISCFSVALDTVWPKHEAVL